MHFEAFRIPQGVVNGKFAKAAYLKTENLFQKRELYKSFWGVWHPEQRHWTLPPGKNLRRSCKGGWVISGDAILLAGSKQWLLGCHYGELEIEVGCLMHSRMRRVQQRRAARNRG